MWYNLFSHDRKHITSVLIIFFSYYHHLIYSVLSLTQKSTTNSYFHFKILNPNSDFIIIRISWCLKLSSNYIIQYWWQFDTFLSLFDNYDVDNFYQFWNFDSRMLPIIFSFKLKYVLYNFVTSTWTWCTYYISNYKVNLLKFSTSWKLKS